MTPVAALFYGILIGLLPTVALAVLLALSQRDHNALEDDYEELKGHSRQVCSEAEFAASEIARLKGESQTWELLAVERVRRIGELEVERRAESERASANSERIQQLQDELEKQRDYHRRVDEVVARKAQMFDMIEAIVYGESADEEDDDV